MVLCIFITSKRVAVLIHMDNCVCVRLSARLPATVCLFAPLSSVIRDFHQVSTKSALRIEIEERCNYWIKDQGIERIEEV